MQDGIATGEIDVISSEERDNACRRGLEAAIANKTLHDGSGCTLVVLAQGFYAQLLDKSALEFLVDTVLAKQSPTFDEVCVLDSHPGFFVKRTRSQCAGSGISNNVATG